MTNGCRCHFQDQLGYPKKYRDDIVPPYYKCIKTISE